MFGTETDRLKRRARKLYRQMQRELDTVDCGISLLCTIRPAFARIVTEFDATMDRLRAIDPSTPPKEPR